jgi:hypothetical protein
MTGIIYTLFSNLNLGRYHFVVTRVGLVGLTRVVGSLEWKCISLIFKQAYIENFLPIEFLLLSLPVKLASNGHPLTTAESINTWEGPPSPSFPPRDRRHKIYQINMYKTHETGKTCFKGKRETEKMSNHRLEK